MTSVSVDIIAFVNVRINYGLGLWIKVRNQTEFNAFCSEF